MSWEWLFIALVIGFILNLIELSKFKKANRKTTKKTSND